MGKVGVEPTRPCSHWILSPTCMPFHHLPTTYRNNPLTLQSSINVRLKARAGIEPAIVILQTTALPLGYRATIFLVKDHLQL